MKKITTGRRVNNTGNAIFQMVRIIVAMILLVAVSVGIFLQFYSKYNDKILYSERLNQMQNVTAQLFAGLEDVVRNQWETVDILCNYMELEQSEDMDSDTLQAFMDQQASLNNLNRNLDSPWRISFVSNTVTTNRTKMVFLKKLTVPIDLQDGTRIIYYGITRDMSELEPYFDCAAYEGSNAIYVVDQNGLKLFTGHGGELIRGFNVYNVLEGMEYLHNTSFDIARQELEENGTAYSNAMFNDEEYYYALYRMENAEWTLVFFVKSSAVALNTVELVNTTMYVVLIFALLMAAVCTLFIIWMLRRQQKKELAAAEENNRKIQASSHHLLGLINDVLDMSKIETIIRPQTVARRQNFEIRVDNIRHENIFCDGTRLQQVLQNILSS